ncbi:MAG: cytochrome c biogenesis protein CcsA [Bacteroidota bacterium]
MIHFFAGHLGHFFSILTFVSAVICFFSFYKHQASVEENQYWRKLGFWSFLVHSVGVIGVVTTLYYIIANHYFEYHYAYSHSSKDLPFYYMISAFWEGQEGSFLLWMFWHVVIGFFLVGKKTIQRSAFMAVFMAVQAFLSSMILGVVLFNFKLGSSPFLLLRDVLEAPIFQINPDFIPEDGSGLNPLLQNYWMVIHPPTLFLGFALVLVPFAFCISGLWKANYTGWIKEALPWTLVASMVLGVGIIMGAYWAYETLSFGGYWNWDPVENAVYIPWLILVASYHLMIVFQKKKTGMKAAVVLTISSFILILYSTFLTRSGILGNASVHSFTDLGLSGQLLCYLLLFLAISVWVSWKSWSKLPSTEKESSTYSGEFWVFIGATVLGLMAFQVLIPTSIPVFNEIAQSMGFDSNMAPPADQVEFYTKFQLWFAVAIVLLSATGQVLWWKRVDSKNLKSVFYWPVLSTLIVTAVVLMVGRVTDPIYIIIITSSIYAISANGGVAIRLMKLNPKLSGGAITHIAVALMLIGILTSSGYSNIVSMNNTGMLLVKDAPDEINKENVLLWFNEPRQMAGYELTYKGAKVIAEGIDDYVEYDKLVFFNDKTIAVAKEEIVKGDEVVFSKGDTVEVKSENTYYEVEYSNSRGKTFQLYPRAQINPEMGGLLASPDIRRAAFSDLYTHISMVSDPEGEIEWSDPREQKIKKGERFFVNDYVAVLESVGTVEYIPDVKILPGDITIQAVIRVSAKEDHFIKPVYIIRDNLVGRIADQSRNIGLKIVLKKILPEEDSFIIETQTTQKDFIIMKAIEKPLINILWLGTLLMVVGFVIAIRRRFLLLE